MRALILLALYGSCEMLGVFPGYIINDQQILFGDGHDDDNAHGA